MARITHYGGETPGGINTIKRHSVPPTPLKRLPADVELPA